MIITRPNYELVTKYLFDWSKTVISQAKKRRFSVIDLKGKQANRQEFTAQVKKNKPRFIFLNGHGDRDLICGQNDQVLIKANDNDIILKGSIVFARSCRSAAKLGRASVKEGTKAYIGYTDDFIFSLDEERSKNPIQDKIAGLFLGPSNLVAVALLQGKSAGEAEKAARDDFSENINLLKTTGVSKENRDLIIYLQWDMQKQVCLGNKNARLKK